MVWTGFRRNCIGALRQRQRWRRASSSPPSAASLPHRQMLKQGRTRWKRDLTTLFSDNAKPQERLYQRTTPHIAEYQRVNPFFGGVGNGRNQSGEWNTAHTRAQIKKNGKILTIRLDSRGGPHKRALAGDWRTPTPRYHH